MLHSTLDCFTYLPLKRGRGSAQEEHEVPWDAVADIFPIKSSLYLFQNRDLLGSRHHVPTETAWGAVHTPVLCNAEPGAHIQFMKIVLQDACSAGQVSLPGL